MSRAARAGHLVVLAVTAVALVLQLVLVVQGHAVLDDVDPPGTGRRLVRFFSYFTILSNLLVAITSARLALGHDLDTRLWRVLRLNALVGITVTGIVHFLFLRGLLDLSGADLVADTLLHRVVPPLCVVVWLALGPRGRIGAADLAWSAVYPVLYMLWTLVHGEASGFWPYPFTDVDDLGLARVALNGLGVVALMVVLSVGARALDRLLDRHPA